jgi:hypothetical protein
VGRRKKGNERKTAKRKLNKNVTDKEKGPTITSHRPHITYTLPQFQPLNHTVHTSPTRYTKPHHITAPNITPQA